jgi:ribosomal-protein-alanine N-acetyltransferase
MEIQIEAATIQLLNELYEIEKQSFKKEAFSKRQIAYLLKDYNTVSLMSKVHDEIAGFIIAGIEQIENESVGHIMTIEVLPIHRRKGIAERLMLEIETILQQKGVKEMRLEVREGNVEALGLYLKLGYQKISTLEGYYGESHGLYLRKLLP